MHIIVCDDHPVVREGLMRILSAHLEASSVSGADSGQALLDLIRRQPCDLVLLDMALPGRNGLDVLWQLKHERPRLPVLVLSVHAPEQYAVRALRAGASGYLTKNLAPEQLVDAVKTVSRGQRYLTADVADQLASDLARPAEWPSHDVLSDREFEVLGLLADGKSVKEIAEALSLSYNTISTYRTRILSKLRLKSAADLIKYALRHGIAS